jgi:N-acetylmuramoyl-L-alanine amidase
MRKRRLTFLFFIALLCAAGFIVALLANDLMEGKIVQSGAVYKEYARTVVIDPGHGGPDGGAVSHDGVVEKDLNLLISLKLKSFFEISGYKVIMTRSDDRSIHDEGSDTLRQKKHTDLLNRLEIVSQNPKAVFISIHQNTFGQSKYYGTQVFYSANNDFSRVLAKEIQETVKNMLQPENERQIKKAEKNLYILYHAKSPAVMVECGFLSNPAESEKLKSDSYQNQMAFSILSGTLKFYSYSGDPGSFESKN